MRDIIPRGREGERGREGRKGISLFIADITEGCESYFADSLADSLEL